MQSTVTASVLPAGTIPPTHVLPHGKHAITIVTLGSNDEMALKYPDGFTRIHQAKTIEELAPKITRFLRARYGADSVTFLSAPALAQGALIEVEI